MKMLMEANTRENLLEHGLNGEKEMSHGRRTEFLLDKRNYRKTRKRLKENQRKIVEVAWNIQK